MSSRGWDAPTNTHFNVQLWYRHLKVRALTVFVQAKLTNMRKAGRKSVIRNAPTGPPYSYRNFGFSSFPLLSFVCLLLPVLLLPGAFWVFCSSSSSCCRYKILHLIILTSSRLDTIIFNYCGRYSGHWLFIGHRLFRLLMDRWMF